MSSWKVPFVDYSAQYQKIRAEVLATVDDVLSRGDVMLRGQLEDFEAHLAAFVGTRFAIGTGNCTDAMTMVLHALGIGEGDQVITVSHTFVATAAAIHHSGAEPVLVDIGDDGNMDVELVAAAITPSVKAIMPVHLNGRLCRMDRLMEVAKQHDLAVIEDSAQALGASFDGVKGGAWGVAGCFSFYPAKLLGAYGDAGAVTTDEEHLAAKLRLLRNHGRAADGDIARWSFNSRMDNLHAAILDLKLLLVPGWIERRRELASLYQLSLSDVVEITLPPSPAPGDEGYFDIFQNFELRAERRDDLMSHLKAHGIETMIPWGGKSIHQFEGLGLGRFKLPRTDDWFKGSVLVPLHCELTDDQIGYVADTIRAFYQS